MIIYAALLATVTILIVFLEKDYTSIIEGLYTSIIVHKRVEIVKKGASLLRTRAASETLKNLLALSEKRIEMVSERILWYCNNMRIQCLIIRHLQ